MSGNAWPWLQMEHEVSSAAKAERRTLDVQQEIRDRWPCVPDEQCCLCASFNVRSVPLCDLQRSSGPRTQHLHTQHLSGQRGPPLGRSYDPIRKKRSGFRRFLVPEEGSLPTPLGHRTMSNHAASRSPRVHALSRSRPGDNSLSKGLLCWLSATSHYALFGEVSPHPCQHLKG